MRSSSGSKSYAAFTASVSHRTQAGNYCGKSRSPAPGAQKPCATIRRMESKPLELGLLRSFSPLDGLKSENLHALARKTALHSLSAGRLLFKEGDTDKRTYYVVSGVLELLHENRSVLVIRGGTPEARNPIAPGNPRRYAARVVSDRMDYVAMEIGRASGRERGEVA